MRLIIRITLFITLYSQPFHPFTTMKKSSFAFALGLMILFAASCGNGRSRNGQTADSLSAQTNSLSAQSDTAYCGIYRGTLPAADCPGINAVISIRPDSTYSLTFDYIERPDAHFEESGIYHLLGDTLIQLVTPSSGAKSYYKILSPSSIIMTDSLGVPPTGEMAKMYVLKK